MGIKGIYGELGRGERIALSKLAVEHFERTGRPLRLAIDISIWQFQIQSGKGGSNPALRTFYYRLVRLLALNIQPLFVFDGPEKPPFKRNVRTAPHTASMPNFLAKQLLKLFGFPYHSAPGEAEAECALFQQNGLVDAVLSEDVDTLMFGCGLSLRGWSSEGSRGNKSPTHVDVYDAEKIKTMKGLDREGMVLVALMSGGDYITAGMTGCGIKTACEAAKAGFGHDLCKLSRKDPVGLRLWRERLEYELHTNESGYFRVKHKSLKIPETFPDKAVLGYYTHPVVSTAAKLSTFQQGPVWEQEVDVVGLRIFVAEAFEWCNLSGAKKFIRGLAPALLTHRLRVMGEQGSLSSDTVERTVEQEAQLVQAICGRRTHFSTDGTPELRVGYVPASIVRLDLEAETDSTSEGRPEVSDDPMSDSADEPQSRSTSPAKRRAPSQYNPLQPEKIWVLETFMKIGIPLAVETWEEDMRNPKKFASREARTRQAFGRGGMRKGALERFVKVYKPGVDRSVRIPSCGTDKTIIPPVSLAPGEGETYKSPSKPTARRTRTPTEPSEGSKRGASRSKKLTDAHSRRSLVEKHSLKLVTADMTINPWTISQRPSDAFEVTIPKGARYSALGIYGSSENAYTTDEKGEDIRLSGCENGLPSPCPSPPAQRKHSRSPSPAWKLNNSEQVELSDPQAIESTRLDDTSIKLRSPSPSKRTSPSRHKKRTPTLEGSSSSNPIQLQTPTNVRTTLRINNIIDVPDDPDDNYALTPLSTQKLNRRIDFTSPTNPYQASPASIFSSLPSPSILLSPPRKPRTGSCSEIATLPPPSRSGHDIPPPTTPSRNLKPTDKPNPTRTHMIALRESLSGTWKPVDSHEARVRKTVYQGVEVVDLSHA
ncbi:hypothetical protein MMC16_003451 [Acarospora aff. strigata]|nr:hypothetical protein [Acarospora aff. strigata]